MASPLEALDIRHPQLLQRWGKRSHDLDVHLNGSAASENAGEHGYTLFGEGIRRIATTSLSL